MKRSVSILGVTLLAMGLIAWAAPQSQASPRAPKEKTWTGVVSDSNCGAKHSTASDAAAECVKKCITGGATYVLVSGGKVYELSDQSKFADFAGKSVKVTGTLKGKSIEVTSVEGA